MGDDFYTLDQRCGSIVTINDKSAYNLFNADLKSLKPLAGSVTTNFSKSVGKSSLFVNDYDISSGGFIATFYVGGSYKEDCYINTSNLIAECRQCIFKTSEDHFEYDAVLTSFSVTETGVEFYNEVSLTFSAVKRLPMVTKTFTGGQAEFKNVGSVSSGAILKITPSSNMSNANVAGITISNLNSGQVFIIDGIEGEVKCNGVNKFLDTNMIDFPKVNPGDNTITFSSGISLEISYYPTFII